MSMDSFDAAVVGAGPNGLAAALALQATGRTVVVYESRARAGGGMWTEELTLPGFRHDTCSAIHPMAAASPFLRTLPLGEHGLEWVHPDIPLAHPLDDGRAVFLHRSVAKTAAALGADEKAYRRLIQPLVDGWPTLVRAGMGPPRLPDAPLLMARFGAAAALPTTFLARTWFSAEPARALLAGLAAHSVLPLEHTPSAAKI